MFPGSLAVALLETGTPLQKGHLIHCRNKGQISAFCYTFDNIFEHFKLWIHFKTLAKC